MILLNNQELLFSKFPNGETKVEDENMFLCEWYNTITFKYQDDSDFVKLMFIKRYLDETSDVHTNLVMKYMPYSRMDRSEDGSVFTLKYIAKFINNLEFDRVTIWEAHSDVTPALLNNCTNIGKSVELAKMLMDDVGFDKDKDYIYFPDITAEKHYSKYFVGCKHLTGLKNRDFKTGEIKSLSILGEIVGKDFRVVMIDDLICKGGTAFYGAIKLKKLGAGKMYVAICHCENAIYEGKLFDGDLIEKIYTTDSILTDATINPRLIVKDV
jgi:ribose-phosphate pyrophosphokinase